MNNSRPDRKTRGVCGGEPRSRIGPWNDLAGHPHSPRGSRQSLGNEPRNPFTEALGPVVGTMKKHLALRSAPDIIGKASSSDYCGSSCARPHQISAAHRPWKTLAIPLPLGRPRASRKLQNDNPMNKLKKHRKSLPTPS